MTYSLFHSLLQRLRALFSVRDADVQVRADQGARSGGSNFSAACTMPRGCWPD